jgi:hypothetical protein
MGEPQAFDLVKRAPRAERDASLKRFDVGGRHRTNGKRTAWKVRRFFVEDSVIRWTSVLFRCASCDRGVHLITDGLLLVLAASPGTAPRRTPGPRRTPEPRRAGPGVG